MTEQIINIQSFEDKTSKQGKKYTSFKTDQGNMTSWEGSDELKKHMNKPIKVETSQFGKFTNIKRFISEVIEQQTVQAQPTAQTQQAQSHDWQRPEHNYRINIATTSKGVASWEITVRADTEDELKQMLNTAVSIAQDKCFEINHEPAEDQDYKAECADQRRKEDLEGMDVTP